MKTEKRKYELYELVEAIRRVSLIEIMLRRKKKFVEKLIKDIEEIDKRFIPEGHGFYNELFYKILEGEAYKLFLNHLKKYSKKKR